MWQSKPATICQLYGSAKGARMHHGIRMTGLICHYKPSLQDIHWQNYTSHENVCWYAGCLGSRLAFTGAGVDPTTLCTLTVFLYSINYLLQVETRPLLLHFIHLLCSSLFLFIHSPNESALFRCVNHLKVLRLQGFEDWISRNMIFCSSIFNKWL